MRLLVAALCCFASVAFSANYGGKVEGKETCSLTEAVSKYSDYKEKAITTTAKVEKVCQKKGCWMQVRDGKQTMRVTFKDYSFFVPKDLDGKKVKMTGKVMRKEVSVDEQKHYLEDAGASKAEIAKITKPSFEYRFVADGVTVLK